MSPSSQEPQSPARQAKKVSAAGKPSKGSGGNRPGPGPTFVSKLYKILSDQDNARLITWAPSGDAFVVLRPSEFARKVLPTQYKHSQFQSFVRQANMYGFSKISLPPAIISQLLAAGEPAQVPPPHLVSQARQSQDHTNSNASLMAPPTSSPHHSLATTTGPPTSVPHAEAGNSGRLGASGSASEKLAPRSPPAQGKAAAPEELPWAFRHPKFMRGAVDLLPEVRRKARVRRLSSSAAGSTVSSSTTSAVRTRGKRSASQQQQAEQQDPGGDDDGQSGAANDAESHGNAVTSPYDGEFVDHGYGEDGPQDDGHMDAPSSSAAMMVMPEFGDGARNGRHYSLHPSHSDQLALPASPGLIIDTTSNDGPLDDYPPRYGSFGAPFAYPLPPAAARHHGIIGDHYPGSSATAAMFRLAELTSKLADMVTRLLPPDGMSGAAVGIRNDVAAIVNEAWDIADSFAAGAAGPAPRPIAAAVAESATDMVASSVKAASQDPPDHGLGDGSQALPPIHAQTPAPLFPPLPVTSAVSPRAMPHFNPGRSHPMGHPPSARLLRPGPPRGYADYPGGYTRPSPYLPANAPYTGRDAYMSPPYTSHLAFASHPNSRSPADMYWPEHMPFPGSPTHPPLPFSPSSPAGALSAAPYGRPSFPPPVPAGGYASASHMLSLPPLPVGRYPPPPAPASGLRYYARAANGHEDSDEHMSADDGERLKGERYDMALAHDWQR